jgi:hypothetical protein
VLEIAHHPPVLRRIFQGGVFNGIYVDFTKNPTGAAIASIVSDVLYPPTTSASQGTGGAQPTWNSAGYAAFDGSDDNLLSTLSPASSMTLAACFRVSGSAQIAIGSQAGAPLKRCYLGSASSSNELGGGWGDVTNATMKGPTSIAGIDVVGLMRGNGAITAELWQNGVRVFQASPTLDGDNSTALPIGAINAGGSIAAVVNGRVYRVLAVPRYIPDNMVVPIMRDLGRNIVAF